MEMKRTGVAAALAFVFVVTASCVAGMRDEKRIVGSKNYVTKEIRMDPFDRLRIVGSFDVFFTRQEGEPKVEICTSDNLVDLVEVQVTGHTLEVGKKQGFHLLYKKLEVRVFAPDLRAAFLAGSGDLTFCNGLSTSEMQLELVGSGDVNVPDIRCTGDLTVDLSGSGDIDIRQAACGVLTATLNGSGDLVVENAAAGHVKASVAGSGDIGLGGTSETAEYILAGSGDVHARRLEAKRVEASVAGSGDIVCHASEVVKARISGSGSVGYEGDPAEVDVPRKGAYKL